MTGPKQLKKLTVAFDKHLKTDAENFRLLHERMDTLATKEDAQQIMAVINGLNVSGKAVMWIGGLSASIVSVITAWGYLHK